MGARNLFLVILLLGCNQKVLNDNELLINATTDYAKESKMNSTEILGIHNQHIVKVTYPCGDVCPEYTKRIIYYEIENKSCPSNIGTEKEVTVFRGRSSRIETYCIPNIIAENWDDVVF